MKLGFTIGDCDITLIDTSTEITLVHDESGTEWTYSGPLTSEIMETFEQEGYSLKDDEEEEDED